MNRGRKDSPRKAGRQEDDRQQTDRQINTEMGRGRGEGGGGEGGGGKQTGTETDSEKRPDRQRDTTPGLTSFVTECSLFLRCRMRLLQLWMYFLS